MSLEVGAASQRGVLVIFSASVSQEFQRRLQLRLLRKSVQEAPLGSDITSNSDSDSTTLVLSNSLANSEAREATKAPLKKILQFPLLFQW